MREDGLLVLDTSLLLSLKQCNKEFALDVIDFIMFKRKDIWIPQKVNEEVQHGLKNLSNIKSGACGRIDGFTTRLKKSIDEVKNTFISIAEETKKDGYEPLYDILTKVDVNYFFIDILSKYNKEAGQLNEENREFLRSSVLDAFYDFIEEKADTGFTELEIKEIEHEGEKRYSEKIPPGYKDMKKDNRNKYGDLIIWKEIIRKINHINKPIIFVTRDVKQDWFVHDGSERKINPLLEKEIEEKCGKGELLSIMSIEEYIELASRFINEDVTILVNNLLDRGNLVSYIEQSLLDPEFYKLEEELSQRLREYNDIDYINLDTIELVKLGDVKDVCEYEDHIVVNCSVEVSCSLDNVVYFGGDDFELPGEALIEIDLDFIIGLEKGQNKQKRKMISIKADNVSINDIRVVSASDPRGYDQYEDVSMIDIDDDSDSECDLEEYEF